VRDLVGFLQSETSYSKKSHLPISGGIKRLTVPSGTEEMTSGKSEIHLKYVSISKFGIRCFIRTSGLLITLTPPARAEVHSPL